ncbi:unnamed protein product [[Actinomadura] parvosata subsp. kistnae]|uniref:Uncharacterized protein n=1 Tax=[Actinomadura] parvosata subsp. kistnae TaxID=1909395 RepID=A0A1V0AFS2_9ACTN|nr:hypothetical protein [Nonomuraea sp. ATCC 55076]AQZ69057.1 hypothetical protein BKM31_53115 [Nonomuraea sp. ATCC 55076]SPL92368.1 unnamed protein product [Actinomadura parvosata subsp. kistnae]
MTPETYETTVLAGPGGVMTEDVGIITGELTVRTVVAGDQVSIRIQYLNADEWYELQGSPMPPPTTSGPCLHQKIVQAIRHGLPTGLPPT